MSALEQAMRLPDGYSTRRTSGDDGTGQGLVQLLGPDGEVLDSSAGNALSWRLAFARGHAKARASGPWSEVADVARMRARLLEIAQRHRETRAQGGTEGTIGRSSRLARQHLDALADALDRARRP